MHVQFLMDEFANVALPDDFEKQFNRILNELFID